MPVVNFTPAFNYTEQVHYNVSFMIANQPVQMTTPTVWMVFALVGLGLLLLSVLNLADECNDLSGVLATLFLFVSTMQAFAVDTVTGFGMNGILDSGIHEFALMENHTIYHYDFWGVVLGICFVIAMANLYRLFLNYHRITDQEQPKSDMGNNAPSKSRPARQGRGSPERRQDNESNE